MRAGFLALISDCRREHDRDLRYSIALNSRIDARSDLSLSHLPWSAIAYWTDRLAHWDQRYYVIDNVTATWPFGVSSRWARIGFNGRTSQHF